METGMIVEKQELFFLLSCKGCQSCPAIFTPEQAGKPEKIVGNLFRKGQITNVGKRFHVEEPLAGMTVQIARAETLLCLYHGNRERELLYLYPGEKILAVQESFRRKAALRLLYVERKALRLFLEEQGLLSDVTGWEPLPFTGSDAVLPGRLTRRSELEAFPWIRLLVETADGRTGRTVWRMGIVRMGFQEEVVTEEPEKAHVTREPYEAERFAGLLLEQL